jgi:hypothetical protein
MSWYSVGRAKAFVGSGLDTKFVSQICHGMEGDRQIHENLSNATVLAVWKT